jgi:methylated-DNA-[protein]-cysteine S-methyltransferase
MNTPTRPTWAAKFRIPCTVLGIRTANGAITGIEFLPTSERAQAPADTLAERAVGQLERYLDDPHFPFTLPLAHAGTAFRQRVRAALMSIPAGEARTYGELARTLASAPRAVGGACGSNPIALVVPCHRVVAADGSLGGFMQGVAGDSLAIKRWLLTHEGYPFAA